MTDEQIHNIYLHMSGKAEGIAEISGNADFPVLFARAVMEFNRKEWQGLTENEIKHLWYEACQTNLELTSQLIVHLARNIEAKLRAKNT